MRDLESFIDKEKIRELTARFADAANRQDSSQFRALWANESVWRIGPPINKEFCGQDEIVGAFEVLLNSWEFFIQLPSTGTIEIHDSRATSSFYINEIAKSKEGKSNYNIANYQDKLIKENGEWRFTERNYQVIYLDESPLMRINYSTSVR
ncbi:MAG: nuclear transport factor 2 family protein [Bacteroidota bacterium]